MDVLLVQPAGFGSMRDAVHKKSVMVPIALLNLAQPLAEAKFEVGILDRSAEKISGPEFVQYLKKHGPAVVGITCYTETFKRGLQAAAYVKSVDPSIKVVMGGPHVTYMAARTLENTDVDVVVRGEGDHSFLQLVEHFVHGKHVLKDIPGLSFHGPDGLVENPIRLINDLDSLSIASRERVDLSRYTRPASLVASRGCPFECRFCTSGQLSFRRYRFRGLPRILAELDYLVYQLGFRYIHFLDDTLTISVRRIKELCSAIIDKQYPIKWFCESRVDVMDRELVELLAMAGCDFIQFGFESGSQKVLDAMLKKVTVPQMETAVKLCLENGIRPMGNFIVGFPEDTWETVKESRELALKFHRMGVKIGFGALTPFPGTYYYEHARELGLTIHTEDWDQYQVGNPIISTTNFTCAQLREIIFDATLKGRWSHVASGETLRAS